MSGGQYVLILPVLPLERPPAAAGDARLGSRKVHRVVTTII
jgi:hypothetical protein